jgi:hypothetical protein
MECWQLHGATPAWWLDVRQHPDFESLTSLASGTSLASWASSDAKSLCLSRHFDHLRRAFILPNIVHEIGVESCPRMEVEKSAQCLASILQCQSLVRVPPHLSGERAKEDEMEPKARAKIFIVKNTWVCFHDCIPSIITVI